MHARPALGAALHPLGRRPLRVGACSRASGGSPGDPRWSRRRDHVRGRPAAHRRRQRGRDRPGIRARREFAAVRPHRGLVDVDGVQLDTLDRARTAAPTAPPPPTVAHHRAGRSARWRVARTRCATGHESRGPDARRSPWNPAPPRLDPGFARGPAGHHLGQLPGDRAARRSARPPPRRTLSPPRARPRSSPAPAGGRRRTCRVRASRRSSYWPRRHHEPSWSRSMRIGNGASVTNTPVTGDASA